MKEEERKKKLAEEEARKLLEAEQKRKIEQETQAKLELEKKKIQEENDKKKREEELRRFYEAKIEEEKRREILASSNKLDKILDKFDASSDTNLVQEKSIPTEAIEPDTTKSSKSEIWITGKVKELAHSRSESRIDPRMSKLTRNVSAINMSIRPVNSYLSLMVTIF